MRSLLVLGYVLLATIVVTPVTVAESELRLIDGDNALNLDPNQFGQDVGIQWIRPHATGRIGFGAGSNKVWQLSGGDTLFLDAPTSGDDVPIRVRTGGIVLGSDNPSQRYLADADNNDALANHIWYENFVANATMTTDWRMMQLTQDAGGTLNVDGPVNANHTFDLAETFWEGEAVEPGELVVVDPRRPDAVLLSTAGYQATLLGVASTRPGFILGGGAFSLEELEATWGEEIAGEFERQRAQLEAEVFAELPELQGAALRLASPASFASYVAQRRAERAAELQAAPAEGSSGDLPISPESVAAAYEAALYDHKTVMFDRTLKRFFDRRFSAVALTGRVPVKVDGSFGAIQPGDHLTSSPIAGVAMKATRPGPVIGTALEEHSGGAGVIEVFVHRGWYGGAAVQVGRAAPASSLEVKDREITELKRRLAALEARLARVMPSEPLPTLVPTSAGERPRPQELEVSAE